MAGRKAYFTAMVLRLEYRPSPLPRVLLLPQVSTPANQSEEEAFIQNFLSLADKALNSSPTSPDKN